MSSENLGDDATSLPDLSVAELELLLIETESALGRIRDELRQRYIEHSASGQLTSEDMKRLLSPSNLKDSQGRWSDLINFLRLFSTERSVDTK